LKILLDENLPHDLRPFLAHHEAFTVVHMGWGGVKNGKLLEAADRAEFDVLITGDKTLEYEQNLSHRRIALVALSAVNWPIIEPHVAKIVDAVDNAGPGALTRVDCGMFKKRRHKPQGLG
jgi:hypothetical protein